MTKRAIDELGDLLERPYCAVLATHWPDGSVLLSPVWHEWRDGGFNIGVGIGDIKLRHIARDPRVTVTVFDHSWPARGLEVRGVARVTEEGRAEIGRRLSIRYLGPTNGNAYADRVGPGVVVRVEPGTVRAWDFVDETRPDPEIPVFPSPAAGPQTEAIEERAAQAERTPEEQRGVKVTRLDHVQIAIPAGREDRARGFYGSLLGLTEVTKPEALTDRGGCWFTGNGVVLHLGVEERFRPARKAHIALVVADLASARAKLERANVSTSDDPTDIGVRRFHAFDPFGNRIEFVAVDDVLALRRRTV